MKIKSYSVEIAVCMYIYGVFYTITIRVQKGLCPARTAQDIKGKTGSVIVLPHPLTASAGNRSEFHSPALRRS